MAFHVQPLVSQPNLLAMKTDTDDDPPLVKFTTFGSQGSGKDTGEVPPVVLLSKPAAETRTQVVDVSEKPEVRSEEVKKREDAAFPQAKVVESYQSQATAGFAAETHSRDKARMVEDSHESESIFTLVTDQSEVDQVERTGEERIPGPIEDSVHMRKSAIMRLATSEREEFELVHRCCRRMQKGMFAVVSVFKDEDWWLLSVSELLSKRRCEIVLEPGHPWVQKHSAFELASLIDKDPEDKLILPAQRLDLFVPKDADQNLSVQTNASDRRKSASFGPKRDTTRKKVFSGVEYDLGIEIKTHGAKAEVNVSASPPGQGVAMMECFTQADLMEASISLDMSDVERVADVIVPRLQVAQGSLRLRPSMTRRESIASLIPEISGISYQTARVLSNGHKYLISFSSIPLDVEGEHTIYITAEPQDFSGPLEKQLEIDEEEIRQVLSLPDIPLQSSHLEAVADLLIIENGSELHLGVRQALGKRSTDAPAIVVSVDRSERDEYARVPVKILKSLAHEAATRIQSYWRMHFAQQVLPLLRFRRQKVLLCRTYLLSQFSAVTAIRHKGKITATAESLISLSRDERPLPPGTKVSAHTLLSLFTPDTSAQEALALKLQKLYRGNAARERSALMKQRSVHIPIRTIVQAHGGYQYVVSVYKRESGYAVEATPLPPEYHGQILKAAFSDKDLKKVDVDAFMKGLKIADGKVLLNTRAEVVSKVKVRLEGKAWEVTSQCDGGNQWRKSVLLAQATAGSTVLETKCSVQTLIQCIGEVASLPLLFDLSCTILLTLSRGRLYFDTSKPVQFAVVKIQSIIRGFLVRRRLRRKKPHKGKLVAVASKLLAGQKHAIYAYAHEQGITVHALKRGKPSLALEFAKKLEELEPLGAKQYCEQILFPKLKISEDGRLQLLESERVGRRAHLSVQSVATTSITSLPPSPTNDISSPIHSKTIKRYDSIDISDTDEPSFHMKIPTPKIRPERRLRRTTKKRNKSETAQGTTQRKTKTSDVLFIPVFEPPKCDLITKVGADISGSYCIVAVYRTEGGVRVEATQPSTNHTLRLSIPEPVPEDHQEAEVVCAAIIDRLRLKKTKDSIVLDLRPIAPAVLYKRSHYVSERYMVVTVVDLGQSVELQAADPANQKVLKLTLGKMKFLSQEVLYRELCGIVKRLRVEKVLGEDVLVLSQ